jgi:prevent-host-death family protein
MREREEPMTQTMNASAVRDDWSEVLNRVFRKETRVVVEKSGIPVAGIVSADDLERLNQLDAQRREGLNILEASQAAFADEPPERVEAEITKAIAAVRRENRRREQPQRSA